MDSAQVTTQLKQKLLEAQLPVDVKEKLSDEISRIELVLKSGQYKPETDKQIEYINFICSLPWEKSGQDILDLARAKQILDKNHHGLEPLKERVLEYLSILILDRIETVPVKLPL